MPIAFCFLPALHTAFNTAVRFITNTDWRSYRGETTMSHLPQTLGMMVQNLLSAATARSVSRERVVR